MPRLSDEQAEMVARSVSVVGTARRGRVTARDVCALLDYNAAHGVTSYAGYAKDRGGARMLAIARELGLYDPSTQRRRERVGEDARLVGKWIQEGRTAAGKGGGEYGAPAGGRAANGRRGDGDDVRTGRERGRGERPR